MKEEDINTNAYKSEKRKPLSDRNGNPINRDAQYAAERRAVEILKVLKQISDEKHPVTQSEIRRQLTTTANAGTLSKSIDQILYQLDALTYENASEDDYPIKYKGYEQNLLKKKMMGKESRENGRPISITNLEYVHSFSYKELDKLIELVSFSGNLSGEEKNNLIRKLIATSSQYYKSPFYDKESKQLRFNPYAVSGRTQVKGDENKRLSENLKVIQKTINDRGQIAFEFNDYDAMHGLEPRNRLYRLSPYYIVVYQDLYYVIGGQDGAKNASHYRIDLMTNVTVAKDADENPLSMIPMSKYLNLPGRDATWDPEKYMSEHLYMSYDEPRRITVKIETKSYTILHDWFGNHYKKLMQSCEEGYALVEIVSSPNMIVHWALQYGGSVEIMNEDIREKIREEIKNLEKKYKE